MVCQAILASSLDLGVIFDIEPADVCGFYDIPGAASGILYCNVVGSDFVVKCYDYVIISGSGVSFFDIRGDRPSRISEDV